MNAPIFPHPLAAPCGSGVGVRVVGVWRACPGFEKNLQAGGFVL